MLLLIAAVLALLWLFGFLGDVGGGLVHLLLLVAVVVFVYHLMVGRSRV